MREAEEGPLDSAGRTGRGTRHRFDTDWERTRDIDREYRETTLPGITSVAAAELCRLQREGRPAIAAPRNGLSGQIR
jgi:hypothetical protein